MLIIDSIYWLIEDGGERMDRMGTKIDPCS